MARLWRPILVASLILAASATGASAAPNSLHDDPLPTVAVTYADLNLERDADVQKLLGRLSRAANDVCRAHHQGQKEVEAHRAYQACRSSALQAAVESVASAKVSAAYAARSPERRRTSVSLL